MRRDTVFGVCRRTKKCSRIYVALRHAQIRAKERGLEFKLTAADIWPMPDRCPVLDILFSTEAKVKVADDSPTIDRIDNTRGYVADNVWWICFRANKMKSNASPVELLKFAEWVMKAYG